MAKIAAQSLHLEAAGRIRELIRKGKLAVGQKIVETELCEALGISRTPLREALRTLSSQGLVELVPNRGAFVSRPSADEIGEMFQVMELLEGACARLAASKMVDADLSQLEKVHAQLEQHYRNRDQEGYIRANNVFHTLVQRVAGNKTLDDVINGLREKVFLYRYQQLYVQDRFDQSIREHREVLAALRKRDAAAAETLMQRHLRRQAEALMDRIPGGADSPDRN